MLLNQYVLTIKRLKFKERPIESPFPLLSEIILELNDDGRFHNK